MSHTSVQQTDETLLSHRQYLENLLRIADVLSNNSNLDVTLSNLMHELLDIFQTNRAWLLYPCDPQTASWHVPVEAATVDYPGAFASGEIIPIDDATGTIFKEVLAAPGAVIYDFDAENTPPQIKKFSIKTQMVIALRPKGDKPWMLGMHQCSHAREWSDADKSLFRDIAMKVSDMLTQRLLLQRLEEELKLRTAMQDELVRAKEEAEAANRAKSEFLSVMSHELRTPLTSVQGALALLLGNMPDELPARAVKMLDIAQRNGERLMRLINDLLDISKIEAGKMEIQPAKHPLQGLLQQAVEANRAYADSMEIKQRLFMPEQTVYAMVDEDKFQQVMANLISNAIKFSPKINTIEIHLATHDNHARITVKDYGSGIPEAFRPMIFDKFTQHDAADTRKQGGTGLGLAITRHLVESMQGRIDFSSTTGMGSEFYVELPIPE